MVTLGSIQPPFQSFHGASSYDDALNFQSFELALNDVTDLALPPEDTDPAEETAQETSKPARRRSSIIAPPAPAPADRSGLDHIRDGGGLGSRPTYHKQSSAHKLFRPAKPEQTSWQQPTPLSNDVPAPSLPTTAGGERPADSRLRASSWHAAADTCNTSTVNRRSPPPHGSTATRERQALHAAAPRSPKRAAGGRGGHEILDGSDVLQQISNLTSTEPSNEREVFVGGLRESEDSVHITEEELAIYFAKFGVIESVSINRDDRTHRGRGFAFVKFFHESAALNAVVADASTHVIRGTTVSVQWSRGAKDAGDRPRRRNSASSAASSGNGSSPSRGSSRSSPKMGMYPHKGLTHRHGGGSCSSGCSRGFSPMRSRSQGHIHGSGSEGGSIPYGYCGGGHGGEHLNQPMVCVVVPAQRAAALGLSQIPGHHSMSACTSRGSPPRDVHFTPLAQGSSAGGGHSAYPAHTRSHSYTPLTASSHGHGHGHGGGGPGGYGHHSAQNNDQHHSSNTSHHVSPKAGHSYGAHAPIHMTPVHHHERKGRTEPRNVYALSSSSNGSIVSGGSSASEYERAKHDISLPSTSYPPHDYDGPGSRGMGHGMLRSQSPPAMMRSSYGTRNGGGAPRPPPTPPRGYDNQYPSSRYGGGGLGDGFSAGITATGRRHSGSSVIGGRSSSMRQDALAAANYFYSVGEVGNGSEHAYDRDYSYAGPSRMA